ncbi:MAG TPA: nuclear transport factor 2 family protein [Pyrinomonadaceae bacterium]|jgi:ketosteroid isomerase-like protein
MSEQIVRQFIDALGGLEAERDLDGIVKLFAPDCEVGNVVSPEKFKGRDGAREFWGAKYRETFGEVKSTFRNVFTTEKLAALEWTTEGTAADGSPIRYDGVSILEIEGEFIARFRAYFDAGSLGRQLMEKGQEASA